ncbi:MAG: glycosyl hydrolase family 18 protein [Candidatus Dormibacteraeota bacterium]|nr:glycosyl hydrolase family 18 protein [Candidatus Dormibacteraeota bacterium]
MVKGIFRGYRLVLIGVFSVVIPFAGLAPLPTVASAPQRSDPASGPHTRDEAQHQHDVLSLTPARTAIAPRRAVSPRALSPAGGVTREVFGFAPYWRLAQNPNWNYSLLSTVAYFGININPDGSISTNDSGWTGWNSQDLATIINNAHAAGDRVVLVIKPNGAVSSTAAVLNAIVTNPAATQAAITNTINLVASKNLDGVNVDFEGTANGYPNVQSGFTNFMTQMSKQVHARWPSAQVTVCTYSGSASWDAGIFKIGDLSPVVDGIFVMAYDMAPGNMAPGQAGPNAPLNGWTYNDTLSVSQYLTKAPASKVMLGVAYYGYKYSTTSTGPYATIKSGTGATADMYSGIVDDLACAQQLTQNWDGTAQSPWASWWSPPTNDPCGGNYNSWRELYYDNATSLGYKYDLVNNNNLMGTGMWALGYDGTSVDLWRELSLKFGSPWPGQYHAMSPHRILDTRNGLGKLGPGQTFTLPVAGYVGVPATGTAGVMVNVTVTRPDAPSWLTIYPCGVPRPSTSNLNFNSWTTIANLVEVSLGRGGAICIYNGNGNTDVVVDVEGWLSLAGTDTTTAGLYRPVVPARLLDTRIGTGGSTTIRPGQSIDLQVAGKGNVPATGASAAVLNVTATNPTSVGYLTVYPAGTQLPGASNLNFKAGQTVPNRAIAMLGTGGAVSIFNGSGNTDVVVDVGGWFTDGSDTTATGGHFTGLTPDRILDTRTGNGGVPIAPLGPNSTMTFTVAGRGGVPMMSSSAPPTAVIVNMTVTYTTANSYLIVYPGDASQPLASDLNWVPGQTVPNLVIVKLGADGTIAIHNGFGSTHVVVDVLGYIT